MFLEWEARVNPFTISEMVSFRAILLWLMMLAVPFQGYAAAAMAFCAPEPVQPAAGFMHDHSQHDHASAHGVEHHAAVSSDDRTNDHAAQGDTFHKCGNCASCHSVGLMPTIDMATVQGLPQAGLAEPFQAMATVSPRVPHKPPRA
ncbi:MAG: hypothetical protein EOP82_28075 [Variovorax sp.]|nr:MAG: hypothetical protein EOP82_28075 [Variovorax sp.]